MILARRTFRILGPLSLLVSVSVMVACSTYNLQAKTDIKTEIPPLEGAKTLPLRAALVIPESFDQPVTSPEFSCPLYAKSATLTIPPREFLAKAGVPTLAQAFESLDLVTDKAAAQGHYDLYIELGNPRISFTQDCHPVETAIMYLLIVGIFLTTNSSPDFNATIWIDATVTGVDGTVLAKKESFGLEYRVLYGNIVGDERYFSIWSGHHVNEMVADIFKKIAVSVTESAKVRQYVRSIKREPAPAIAQPLQPLDRVETTPLATTDVDLLPAARSKPAKNRHAVVIGIERYRKNLPQADYAANDARVMADYLTKVLGYPEENVALLLNDNAAKTDLEKYLEGWLPNRVEKGDSVFVYFSGHGAPNAKTGKAYLVPYDGDPSFVDQTAYPLERLYDRLGKLPAKEIVVVLDSCFSGAGGRSVIAKGMRPMVLSIENPVLAGGKTAVIAASSGDQVSSTYDEKKHGLLTYYLLKGLRGEADRDKSGSIELAELFEYVKPQVERTARREFNNEQSPQLLESPELLKRGVRLIERQR